MNSFIVNTIAKFTEATLYKLIDNYYLKNEEGQIFGTTVFPFPAKIADECKAKNISVLRLDYNNCKKIESGFDFLTIKRENLSSLHSNDVGNAFDLGFLKREEIAVERGSISEFHVRLMLMDMAKFAASKEMSDKWSSDTQAFYRQRDLFIDKQIKSIKRTEWQVRIETELSWEFVDNECREPVNIYKEINKCVILVNK
jgi:hypothetical protein